MRILYIIDTLSKGGAERVCIELANSFTEKGYEVGIIFLLKEGSLANELHPNIKRYALNRKWKFNPFLMYKMISIMRKFDIIHVHMRHVMKYVLVANLFWPVKIKFVFHDHFGKHIDFLIKLLRHNYIYVGVSNDLKEWAIDNLKISEAKAFCIPNIVRKYSQKISKEKVWKDRIVLVSNIRKLKNVEFAIDLLYNLHQRGYLIKLDVIGEPIENDYFNSLVNKIQILRLGNYVNFIYNESRIQSIIGQYAVGMHTSPSETGPLVLIEYLACGLPFLSFKTGEVAAQLANELPDFFISDFEINHWIERLIKLVDMDRGRLQERMSSLFDRLYNQDHYISQWQKVYKRASNY